MIDNFPLISTLGGLLLAVLSYFAKKAHDDINAHRAGLAALELKLAEHYVNKSDQDALAKAIFMKLDRIEDKIDKKADK